MAEYRVHPWRNEYLWWIDKIYDGGEIEKIAECEYPQIVTEKEKGKLGIGYQMRNIILRTLKQNKGKRIWTTTPGWRREWEENTMTNSKGDKTFP